ncbi:hypothetical protein [Nonomuraea cavernae]|uniref:hypothetical protein n=1 Tax=Nonomuraea cavernae TaxID=2045107 RepID=UPI0033F3C693
MRLSRIVRGAALTATALILASGVSACGGGDDAATGGGGGGVDKAALISKLKAEPDYKDVPDTGLDCLAGVFLKYGDEAGLKAYVEGKDKLNDLQAFGASEAQAKIEAVKCAT